MGIVKKLTHGNGSGALLPKELEIAVLLGSERVFDKERMIALEFLAKVDRINRFDPLVHVMQQIEIITKFVPDVLECFGHHFEIGSSIHVAIFRQSKSGIAEVWFNREVRRAVTADLNADMSETTIAVLRHGIFKFL